ncbi:hypothetical protein KV100_07575 [Mumia sp. zg.B21]|uniref:hypothetical protein n=1 Tax=Mumia sp. zg.B21 TaxID=2855447 RepID=UPI001C6E4E79|nr:hypothetical protein [Mumia sp. zg.B21]MBW9209512.1 hypothetical protein [Mumia sp. zg.B21]
MHASNHYYGQAHVFARFCGLDREAPPKIDGLLQHGWNPLHGQGFQKQPIPLGYPQLVWSDAARRRGQAYGWRNYYVVGAAWSYLVAMEPADPAVEREGTIFYPFHGWESGRVDGSHQALADEIRATEDGHVTVCLYWLEFDEPAIRDVYERAGFHVISHGRRGRDREGTDPEFMYRQLVELRRHRRVASNRVSTAIMYGASVDCEVGIYGDPMSFNAGMSVAERKDHVLRLLPEMHGLAVAPAVSRAVSRYELSMDRLASPAELRELFGWRGAYERRQEAS